VVCRFGRNDRHPAAGLGNNFHLLRRYRKDFRKIHRCVIWQNQLHDWYRISNDPFSTMVGSNFTKRYANKTRRQFYAKNIVSEYRGDTFEANIPFLGKLFGHPGFFLLLSIQ